MQAKRRQQSLPSTSDETATPSSPASVPAASEAELQALCAELVSADPGSRLRAVRSLRQHLAGDAPPVPSVVRAGAVDALVKLLGAGREEEALEAGCCLTNIASWDEGATRAAYAAAPVFLTLLQSASVALREQGAWAVGNFAAESEDLRRRLIADGAVALVAALLTVPKPTVQARAAWALSNLARGAAIVFDPFRHAEVPSHLSRLIAHPNNDLATEAAWVAAFLSAKGDEASALLVREGVVAAMAARSPTLPPESLVPVVRAMGNVAACVNDSETVSVLEQPTMLPMIGSLLREPPVPQFRREVLWLLANLCAAPAEHSAAVVAAGLLVPVCAALDGAEFAEQREAATAVANLSHSHPAAVVAAGAHVRVVRLLRAPDITVVAAVAEGLDAIMAAVPRTVPELEAADLIDALESVQYSSEVPAALARRCGEVKDAHFGGDYGLEDEEDDDIAGGGAMPFGQAPPFGMAGVAGAAVAPPAVGRGRGAVQPAWMTGFGK